MAESFYLNMTVGNDKRELTLLSYPNMDYGELVVLQAVLSKALVDAGISQAQARGFDMSELDVLLSAGSDKAPKPKG